MWDWVPRALEALDGLQNPWIYIPAGIAIVLVAAGAAGAMYLRAKRRL
ncbi:MAG: hypothetical protein AAFQ38_12895 [Pseudomonadota bacterium]